ncbi:ABC transporter permease subunit [Paenibacillus barcinonensis]|jgi:putative aldouronate transport system permease protein|uniref:ABC transporter permease n=1 Tax=Paenibacillus barcinonensis TaxID=198119 RepID=UPI001C1017B0|nr:ABC transporter permease subunit [Paenibacillus barcinonensis]MBU5352192.1 ABC transporter permease subunit [Paenibacillus barcinonensis]
MLVPAIICVLVYNYIPLAGILISFKDYSPLKGFSKSPWVGLDNFRYMLELPSFYQVVWNTFLISIMKIIADLIGPITIALMLNEVRKAFFKRFVQTIIYMPHFFSWVILGGIVVDLLSPSEGIVNMIIKAMGIDPIAFMADNKWFPYVLVITNEWKEVGFSTIIYLAALSSIDPTLYESSVIDGAGRGRQTWHITLPGIRPTIVLLACLSLGNVLNGGFDQVFNMYSPMVYQSGDILDTLVYRIGLVDANYSVATALGFVKSVVSLGLIGTGYWLAYRFANYRIF